MKSFLQLKEKHWNGYTVKIRTKLLLPIVIIFVVGLSIYLPISYHSVKTDLTNTVNLSLENKLNSIIDLFSISNLDKYQFEERYHNIIRKKLYTNHLKTNSKYLKAIFIESYPYIINSKGEIIYYIKNKLDGTYPDLRDKKHHNIKLIDRIISIKNGNFEYYYTKPNVSGIHLKRAFIKYYKKYDYYIIYSFYIDDINKMIFYSFLKIAIPAILMSIIITLIVLLFINKIVKNINNTKEALLDISEGDNDLTQRLEISSKDELGKLGEYFNQFISKLHNLVNGLFIEIDELKKVKEEMIKLSSINKDEISKINEKSNKIKESTSLLYNNIETNIASLEEIAANITSINNQINDQASMVEETTASITEMIASIDNTAKITEKKTQSIHDLIITIEDGNKKLNATGIILKEQVVEKVDGIKKMVEVINDISAQTNLLSINAAIEAAHSGQAGFSVIANEIRNLAESSAKSSKEIVNIIKEITTGINDTEINVNKTKTVFNILNKEIKETEKAFSEINISTKELNEGGNQILEAMTILQNATSVIKGSSDEITLGINEVVTSQTSIKEIADEINNEVKDISDKIEITNDIVIKQNNETENLDKSITKIIKEFVFKV